MKAAEKGSQGIRRLLGAVTLLSLAYYAWMMLDLIIHPFSPGNNPGNVPFLFRWLSGITGTFTVAVATIIILRRRSNLIGPLLLMFGVGATGWSLRTDFLNPDTYTLLMVGFSTYFFGVSFPALVALIFHFPNGRGYPQKFSYQIWGLILIDVLVGLITLTSTTSSDPRTLNPLYIPAFSFMAIPGQILINGIIPAAALTSLGLRYRKADVKTRQQIKWLVYLAAVGIIISIITGIFFPAEQQGNPDRPDILIANVIGYIYWQAFPGVAIGIALLRYRLWDIDLIIRRTLQYGLLTLLLGSVYFGMVVTLEQAFRAMTRQDSPLAIVISTLIIAGIFNPLRRRVQQGINRRFYRRKYDAAAALDRFSQNLRNRVDLSYISNELESVVQETIQPTQISLWIREVKAK